MVVLEWEPAPALDRAIYQTELTVCGTKLHAVGLGAQTYAMNNRRGYPDRRPDYVVDSSGRTVGFAGSFASAAETRGSESHTPNVQPNTV